MSNAGGGSGGASRVSIPNSARKTIQNIKEIAGNHSDEEVYAMLRECNMDPNETAQKLLLQDTFHEVKRKRDRRKENVSSKESVDSSWRSGTQGRGGRGGRVGYSSRYLSHAKESLANQGPDKGAKASTNQVTENKEVPLTSGCASLTVNGLIEEVIPPHGTSQTPVSSGISPIEEKVSAETRKIQGTESSRSLNDKRAIEAISSCTYGRPRSKSQGYEINHVPEELQPRPTSSGTGTSGSRPPSNYSNWSQQLAGSQKVGPVKEWKPKQTNTNVQNSGTAGSSGVATTMEANANIQASEKKLTMLHEKLEELQFSDGQHVIFPSHIQVPESERAVLSFGSFTANVGLSSTLVNDPDNEKKSTPHSESTQEIEENVEEPSLSVENLSPVVQEDGYIQPHSPEDFPENQTPGEAGIPNIPVSREYPQPQQEASLGPEGPQFSGIQTAPVYSTFGLIPPVIGSPFTGLGGSESQARDTSRIPGIVVPQPFDPSTSYYAQVYRPAADSDGRYSPFHAPVAAIKYSASLSSQNDPTHQENGNSLVQPTSVSATVTQAAGVMQNSIAVTQQPFTVFRHPAGLHFSHYPPNYIPFGPYFSPFYVQPSSVHPFISNAAFPHQHPPGTIYPPIAAAAPVKYPISQFKTGNNNAISNHAGVAAGYGPYGSTQIGYSPGPASSTVNSTSNDDLSGSQYKENSVYVAGQQGEGSTVWMHPAPARDVPNLQQPSSFYSLPQGQHVTFTPTQAGHGVFHPSQMGSATVHPLLQQSQTVAGAVEMVGTQGGVYPPPQRAPVNWPNNF